MKAFPFMKKRKIYNYAGIQEIIPIRLGIVKVFLIKGETNLSLLILVFLEVKIGLLKKLKVWALIPVKFL